MGVQRGGFCRRWVVFIFTLFGTIDPLNAFMLQGNYNESDQNDASKAIIFMVPHPKLP